MFAIKPVRSRATRADLRSLPGDKSSSVENTRDQVRSRRRARRSSEVPPLAIQVESSMPRRRFEECVGRRENVDRLLGRRVRDGFSHQPVDSFHSTYRRISGAEPDEQGRVVTGRMFWPAIVVLVIGLFMLVAGIGPLWLPILIVPVGAVAAVMSRRSLRQDRHS
jgi:hypothetical protein